MEMTVVVAIVALLAVLGLPAIRAFVNSLESKGPAEAMISAALSSARAIALKEQRYAGIRFQEAYDPKGPLDAAQYMIFIVYEEPEKIGNNSNGFKAAEGTEPIKLPDGVGVMDLRLGSVTGEPTVSTNDNISQNWQVMDTTTFSIIFSPSGKLVIHDVQVMNKNGVCQPDNSSSDNSKHSMDDIFNSLVNISNYGVGMFVEDDNDNNSTHGFGEESSRNSFVIYERDKFKAAFQEKPPQAWSGYLSNLQPVYVNPYTGTIIKQD
jgi:Tfp pilus assembly protein FimT